MDNLQPGRNYSISVKAVSNGIESIERTVFQATRKYRRTGLAHSEMLSTGLNLYMSTWPAIPIHSCTGASHTGVLVGTGIRTIQGAGPSHSLKK